jgi:hypothetical protein
MKLLYTYEDKKSGEEALQQLTGPKRLASERDAGVTVYHLFGEPTWTNLYRIGLYNLEELKGLLERRRAGEGYDRARHEELIAALRYVSRALGLEIPPHWL